MRKSSTSISCTEQDRGRVTLLLDNATDVWRQELMDLAQQVKTSLVSPDDQELHFHQVRSSRLQKHRQKRSTSSTLSNYSEENDDPSHPKRLLHRRASSQYQRSQVPKSKTFVEKPEPEQMNNDENQDPGIWVQLFSNEFPGCSTLAPLSLVFS